jgi:predicted dehydrogenase
MEARPMEAAIVVTPVESHHSISVFLSRNGVHNHVETTWASTLVQAREMRDTARANGVVARVAENFFRFPIDRFAQAVKRSGYLGRIGRIVSYADHTGYHNGSRWLAFAEAAPLWVQSIEHSMEHPPFYSSPERYHTHETYKARFIQFPDGLLVVDHAANIKGHLGRHPRPGYTEWQGERGTLVHRTVGHGWGDGVETWLRHVPEERWAPAQEAAGRLHGGGITDERTLATLDMDEVNWYAIYADTPSGRIGYENPLRDIPRTGPPWYTVGIADHIVDFALAVRGLRDSEFTDDDALMSEMMELAAHESARQEGHRVPLPLTGDLESDAAIRASLQAKYGVDPFDVDAMLRVSFPRP